MSVKPKQPFNGKAPPGRYVGDSNGTARGRVTDIQRARMLVAMTEVAVELGVGSVTVGLVVERAGVSRRTFYDIFDDSEDCLLAAVDDAIERVSQRVLLAYRGEVRWRERMRAGLLALLGFLEEEPCLGRLLVVQTLAAGQESLSRRAHVLEHLIRAVEEGHDETKALSGSLHLTAEGVVGAVLAVIHARLLEESGVRVSELANPLMSMIVLPYLGAAAARRELERPLPEPSVHRRAVTGNPLKELHIRLTYRTIRVLAAVAEHPGSSNRQLADASGITDQGQISKLLARLQKLDLIENTEPAGTRGEPNAWTLTNSGKEVHDALAAGATGRV